MSSDAETTSPRPNIFLDLAKHMIDVESKTSGVRQVVEVTVASSFLGVVLGRDWYERKVRPRESHDEWMQNRLKPKDSSWIFHHHRVLRLADALFTLLHTGAKGFDTLRKRLRERPTKPCYIEAEIASLLAFNGFQVEIIGESGVRGQDFDFAALRDEISLSIEVTGKEEVPLTVNTIKNTLRKKRTQIPDNRPALLYLQIPATWMNDLPRAQDILTRAFDDTFRGSHRFNGVILVWEQVVPFPGGGDSETNLWACYHNYPKHPFNRWDLLELQKDSEGKSRFGMSLYDFLKGVQAKHLTDES